MVGGGSFRDDSVSDFFECAKEIDHGLGVQCAVSEKVVAETFALAGGKVPELRCREGTRGGVAVLDFQVRIVGAREGREDSLEGSATVLVPVVEPEIPEGNEEVHGAFRNPSDPGLPGERCRTLTEAAILKRGIVGDYRALPGETGSQCIEERRTGILPSAGEKLVVDKVAARFLLDVE